MTREAGDPAAPTHAAVRFDAQGLIPVIAQEVATGEVLLLAYMNAEALRLTLAEGKLVLWSRSRGTLWRKGEQSGNTLHVSELRLNCEGDSLLARVRLDGTAACHEGYRTCYFRRLDAATGAVNGDGADCAEADSAEADSDGAAGLVATVVEPRLFDPDEVYGARIGAPAAADVDAALERDLRALYAAYERLRDDDERPESGTSRRLHAPDAAAMAEQSLVRAREELEELCGVLAGTHRHQGGAADVLLEASQVEYWALLATIGAGYPYEEWQPHLAWRSGWQGATGPADLRATDHATSIPRQCASLLVAAGALCRAAGVHPAQVVAADLAALRARYAERVDRADGSHS